MRLTVANPELAVCQLEAHSAIPTWATSGGFFSITRTPEELSIVCEASLVPPEVKHDPGWQAIQVEGPLDFPLTGILSSLATPLAAADISIFAISTFDTDYVLVKQQTLTKAVGVLLAAGHRVD